MEKYDQIINEIEDLASDFSFDEEVYIELPKVESRRAKKNATITGTKSLSNEDRSLIEEFIKSKGITKCPDGFAKGTMDLGLED